MSACRPRPPGPPVEVGQRGDRDDLVIRRRLTPCGVHRLVARGGHDRDAVRDQRADGAVDQVARRPAAVPVVGTPQPLADAQVDDLDARPRRIVRVAHAQHAVEAAQLLGQQAVAAVVEDLDGPQPGAGGHAHDALTIVASGQRARHVGAVTFAVPPGLGVVVVQSKPPTMRSSGEGAMPVSMIATSTSSPSSTPSMRDSGPASARARRMPVGMIGPVEAGGRTRLPAGDCSTRVGWSGISTATAGSRRSAASWTRVREAANPSNAWR